MIFQNSDKIEMVMVNLASYMNKTIESIVLIVSNNGLHISLMAVLQPNISHPSIIFNWSKNVGGILEKFLNWVFIS